MSDREFYPGILSFEQIKILHDAVQKVLKTDRERAITHDPQTLAKIVLRLYKNGLTEPAKLMTLASLMAVRQSAVGKPV
jgi:hypothetical protein